MKLQEFCRLSLTALGMIYKDGWPDFWQRLRAWSKGAQLVNQHLRSIVNADGDRIPPQELSSYVGGGDFVAVGNALLGQLQVLCNLKPDGSVLDVGCGIGRMAVPLTKYLDNEGRYEGFDTVKLGIDWCKSNIASRYPNFHFEWADIYNKTYNPSGKIHAGEYVFPYPDESFDLVFLTSVFTHMLPGDVKHYLTEIKRVLRSGGPCLATFFLLNSESLTHIEQGNSTLNFRNGNGIYRYEDEGAIEGAIAYEENYIRNLYESVGLRIREPVYRGSWCGRNSFPEYEGKGITISYQDIVIADILS